MDEVTRATVGGFLMGAASMGYAVAALFFMRFWRRTRDRLFAGFAAAFWLLAANRLAMTILQEDFEGTSQGGLYWLRFAAYAVILVSVIDKNRASAGMAGPSVHRSEPPR
jgi:hypothetical protein